MSFQSLSCRVPKPYLLCKILLRPPEALVRFHVTIRKQSCRCSLHMVALALSPALKSMLLCIRIFLREIKATPPTPAIYLEHSCIMGSGCSQYRWILPQLDSCTLPANWRCCVELSIGSLGHAFEIDKLALVIVVQVRSLWGANES